MFPEPGNEMGMGEFVLKRDLLRFRPLSIDELEEIEPDPDAVDSDQIADMFDVVDVTIEGRFFLERADEDGVDPDHPATRADGFDLLVGDVALDVEIFSRVRVRDDDGSGRDLDNVVEPSRADVGQVDDYPESLAFANDV